MKRSKSTRILPYILLSALVGVIVYRFLIINEAVSLSASPVSRGGGSCGEYFYDEKGHGYEVAQSFVDYEGTGPIFKLSEETLRKEGLGNDLGRCVEYPENVPPNIVSSSGTQVFPVEFSLTPENAVIKKGSSISLSAHLKISAAFASGNLWTNLQPGEETEIQFKIFAPNFDVSPSNDDSFPVVLSHSHEANYIWIIAPLERAEGPQALSVEVGGVSFDVWLEVRPLTGINPLIVAVVASLGSFLIGFMTVFEQAIKLWQTFPKNKSKGSKSKKLQT